MTEKKATTIIKELYEDGATQLVYSYEQVGLKWRATLKMPDGQLVFSDVMATKKQAKDAAAQKALLICNSFDFTSASFSPVISSALMEMFASNNLDQLPVLTLPLQPERVRVLVDAKTTSFCDAFFCARFPAARFEMHVTLIDEVPWAENAQLKCNNVALQRTKAEFKEVSDLNIVVAATRLHDRITSPSKQHFDTLYRIVVVSQGYLVLKTADLFQNSAISVASDAETLANFLSIF